MSDKVSKDAKLQAATNIITSYIKTFEPKEGSDSGKLSIEEICKGFEKVYNAIDETIPNETRKVGLG